MKDQCQTTKLNLPFILAFNENRKIFALILTHCLAEYNIHIQPGKYQLSKSIVHEIQLRDIAVM